MSAEDTGETKSEAGAHRSVEESERNIIEIGHTPDVKGGPVRWMDGTSTGAFVSRAASFRYETAPTRWWQLWDLVLLYVAFIGMPMVAGFWAGWRILMRLGL